jgi:hypothetical protein
MKISANATGAVEASVVSNVVPVQVEVVTDFSFRETV